MSPDTSLTLNKDNKLNKQQPDLHIPPIAGFLFGTFLLIGLLSGIFFSEAGIFSDFWVSMWIL